MFSRTALRSTARLASTASTRRLLTTAPRLANQAQGSTATTTPLLITGDAIAALLAGTTVASPYCLGGGGTDPATGIKFPAMVDGLTFTGAGVRVKYGFVKVYAVGAYVDVAQVASLKGASDDDIASALCSKAVNKTIRIVMNRGLAVDKYMAAINEAIQPRMNGKDLECLDKFKAMNPPGELKEGDEMIMTLSGNTMNYRSSAGGIGKIDSEVFVNALADVYFGKDCVSKPAKDAIIKAIKEQ
jgi:hypothetical protein